MTGITAWPGGKRAAAMVTVELDNEWIWSAMGEKYRTVKTLSVGTYGIHRGLDRVLDSLDRHGVCATFFVPGAAAERYPRAVRQVLEAGHEIGLHGYMHEDFGTLTAAEQRQVLERGKRALEDLTGQSIAGFRLPEGNCTRETRRLLAETGFRYDNSFFDRDLPYLVSLDQGQQLVEIPMRWETQDFPYLAYGFGFPKGESRIAVYDQVLENWLDELRAYRELGLCYVIKFDPQVVGSPGRIFMVDRMLEEIASSGMWVATGSEIAAFAESEGRMKGE